MKYEITAGKIRDVKVHSEKGAQNLESSSKNRSGTLMVVLVDLM